MPRPPASELTGKSYDSVPASLQRIAQVSSAVPSVWIGPQEAAALSDDDRRQYDLAHTILCHLCIQGPTKHSSGHPGGPLSAFTFAYALSKRRNPAVDWPLVYSAGHLSLLAYGLQWLFGRSGSDARLASPQTIIDTFRTPSGLPGHVEAGIGDIPFGTGPLGKGVSHGLGTAFALKFRKQPGMVDVLLADGDAQEGQVNEAFRLASHLQVDNLVVHIDCNDVQLSSMPSKTVAADLAAIAAACGWQVIEVQNGNDLAQVSAAQDAADRLAGNGRPIAIVYYTTMGDGIALMEEGSNTGSANYHGSPLKPDVAEKLLATLPALDTLTGEYAPFRAAEEQRYRRKKPVETNSELAFQPATDSRQTTPSAPRKDIGAIHIKALMEQNERIVVLHADLADSGGFGETEKAFPDRVINVGVAEANMVMMAAGMRQGGLLPVCYTFAAFGTNEARANLRLIDINCGHTRCGIVLDCTHSGIDVGEDGETHQEQNYLALPLRHTQVWSPVDGNQAGAMVTRALELIANGHQNVALFSGREKHPQILKDDGSPFYDAQYVFDGRMDLLHGYGDTRDTLTVIALGAATHDALAAISSLPDAEKSTIRLLAVGAVRPLDAASILHAALETQHLIVVEDHNTDGGLASQVADVIADFQLPCSLRRLGLTQFFPSATAEQLKLFAGIDPDSIADAILDELRTEVRGGVDALASMLVGLPLVLRRSRFGPSAVAYAHRLATDTAYMKTLYSVWQSKTCPPEKLPDATKLSEILENGLKNLSE